MKKHKPIIHPKKQLYNHMQYQITIHFRNLISYTNSFIRQHSKFLQFCHISLQSTTIWLLIAESTDFYEPYNVMNICSITTHLKPGQGTRKKSLNLLLVYYQLYQLKTESNPQPIKRVFIYCITQPFRQTIVSYCLLQHFQTISHLKKYYYIPFLYTYITLSRCYVCNKMPTITSFYATR
eukprot:TRINITY_DN4800_c0_g1_i1.p1 TRINITY_DN4800_c0_g1~~TRINITY_DN4800_c0_g1_i1.p1  ORF type:complete len:205 (-),score=-24.77 TRINITY_DN4800_c0_g1_i1:305-844(-)